jgi:hypothetical protein
MSNTTEQKNPTEPHKPIYQNQNTNPTSMELLEIAKRWHMRIHQELETPILPEDLSSAVREKKLYNISRQREKHKLYCRILDRLISNKLAKEN